MTSPSYEKNKAIAQSLGPDWGWSESWAAHKTVSLFAGIVTSYISDPHVDPNVYYVRGFLGGVPVEGIGLTPSAALYDFQKVLNKTMTDTQCVVEDRYSFEALSRAAHTTCLQIQETK